jgi:hypothetical protein
MSADIDRTEFVTVFHVSTIETPYLRPGSRVATSREDALTSAEAIDIGERWMLELLVRRDQVRWSGDEDDSVVEPRHGILMAKSVVVGAEVVAQIAG